LLGVRQTPFVRDPGAPLGLYRLLEAADEPGLIDREMPEDAEILELGSGPGRITRPLLALGRRVVAVDFNPEMLDLIDGAEKIEAPIQELNLGRTFGGVLLMSNLINNPDPAERLALLRTIQRHLSPHGIALIERFDPDAGTDPTPTEHERYGVTIRAFDIRREGKLLYQSIEYDAGARGRWMVELQGARILTDDEMLADLTAAGLRLLRWIDEQHRWLAAALR
jgi:SAM-dependent methyltransferase